MKVIVTVIQVLILAQHNIAEHNTTRHDVPYDGITAPLSLEAGTEEWFRLVGGIQAQHLV
jgi:hypothetical protein